MSIRELLRENIRSLEPYSSARDDFSGTASVFLDANENWQDFVAFDNINRYPDPHSSAVKRAVSEVFGYDERMVSTCFPYRLAALLIAGENRREYSRLSQEYEQRIADFEPCRITEMQVSV